MPKKKRKARSRPAKAPAARRTTLKPVPPAPVDLPRGSETPLVRLEFAVGAAPEQVERAIRYWSPSLDGSWVEPVSALGNPSRVAGELLEVCQAYLLHCLCSACASPMWATSRSDAVSMASSDLRRTSRAYLCRTCRRAQELRQAEEARAAQEQAQAAEEAKKASLAAFFERQSADVCRRHRRTEELTVEMACVLAAMIDRSRAAPVLPARRSLATGWMWSDHVLDEGVLAQLYKGRWIRVDASAPTTSFTFNDDGEMKTFYQGFVPFRLATSPEETREDMMAMLLAHSKDKHLAGLRQQIETLEAHSLFDYLTNLLKDRYHYPPVPESKWTDLYVHLFDGLQDYTFGQMVCFLWRTADTAAGWKERKQLTDAHASSATVTILGGKLESARECKASIPEYDPPRSHIDPPALSAARSLLREVEERIALSLVCELHEDGPLPCSPCLGMLYAGGENAEEIREYYASLGEFGIELRPDLATKAQITSVR